jgi:hypothetical protein
MYVRLPEEQPQLLVPEPRNEAGPVAAVLTSAELEAHELLRTLALDTAD